MSRRLIAVLATALAVGAVHSAQAQDARPEFRFGPQVSLAEDADFGIGGRLEIGLPAAPVFISGSFDIFFPGDDVDYWEFNANGAYEFVLPRTPEVAPYVGAGLNVAHASVGAFSDTRAGLNVLGGVRFPLQSVAPFFELRLEIEGGEQVPVATGGILFSPGR